MASNFQSAPARAARLLALGLAAASLGGCLVADKDPPAAGQPSFYHTMAQAGAQLDAAAAASMISGYRHNNGLGPVTLDPELMLLAQEHTRTMVERNRLDHNLGRPFRERIGGYNAGVAVENVSAGYHTLAEAFSGWRDSPPHRANMLNRGVNRMGIAAMYAPGSKYKVFWTLIMAGPAAAPEKLLRAGATPRPEQPRR
jgi:uncharacterized protein YkwD